MAILPPIHPGSFLQDEFNDRGQDLAGLQLLLPMEQIMGLLDGTQSVTWPIAQILGKKFGQTSEYWMNLQAIYDERKNGKS